MKLFSHWFKRCSASPAKGASTPALAENEPLSDGATGDTAVKVGDILGKYELVGEIGRGSTSFVYLGRHRKLLFPVAVKILEPAALACAPGLLDQLKSEAVLLAQLNHPNIVRLWDLEDEGPVRYLVLEHVPGGSLADLIRAKGAIPIPYAFAIIRQAVEGLAEAHKHAIVHRDVKPGNLLLSPDGQAKVADLGLALVKTPQKKQPANLKQTYLPTGTAAYLAPEQAVDPAGADFRADIYSLGATLYHALTGHLPFQGRSSMEVIMKHLRLPPTSPREYVPELSEEGAGVVLRMLAKKPENRFSSYFELRLALAKAVGDPRPPRPLTETFFDFAMPDFV